MRVVYRDHRKETLSFTVSRYKRVHAAPQVPVNREFRSDSAMFYDIIQHIPTR